MQGVSSSIDYKRMKFSSLESSLQDESNGDIFTFLALINGMLFAFYCLVIFCNNMPSIDAKNAKMPSFDSSRHDDSKELKSILFWSLDGELIQLISCQLFFSIHLCQGRVQGQPSEICKIPSVLWPQVLNVGINRVLVMFVSFILFYQLNC